MTDVQHMTVRSAVAPLLDEPRIAAPLTSQLLSGDVLTVMDRRGDWLQVRGPDAYEGWTHVGYVMSCSGDEDTWRVSLGCQVREASGHVRELPLGARIEPRATVVHGAAIDAVNRATAFPLDATAIAQSAATRYSGASYLWGGVTPWGCDCSGFVQRLFGLHGVSLPRDARQQVLEGRPTLADASGDHAPGDLLFFSDREDQRITHVGVALGAHRMVHSAVMRGGIAIEQLLSDDPYVARLRTQCLAVRRVV